MPAAKRSVVPEEFKDAPPSASEAQKKYIRDLLDQRQLDEKFVAEIKGYLDTDAYSKSDASRVINKLTALPRKTSQFARNLGEMPVVPEGRYAIEHEDVTEGVLKFYRLKIGKDDSRWAGFMFLDAGRGGAHGDLQWTAIKDVAYKKAVLEQIAKDPRAAGVRFGREIGRCYVCGRSLTQEHTRAAGIGDDCASRL
jgi:hypothetical protein